MLYADVAFVAFREGVEALLILGIFAGIAVRAGQPERRKYLWIGAAVAVGTSVLAAWLVRAVAGHVLGAGHWAEATEGAAALFAVVVLTYTVVWMRPHTTRLVRSLTAEARRALSAGSPLVLFAVAFTAVAREGVETVLFVATIAPGRSALGLGVSVAAGIAAAALAAVGVSTGVVRLRPGRFFAVTGAIVVVLAAGLLATGVHELVEAGVLPETDAVWSTERLLPEDSAAGSLAKSLVGYRSEPTSLEAVAFIAYLAVVGGWWARSVAAAAGRRREAQPVTAERGGRSVR
jgi:high-affinity iron transporter